MDSKPFWQSKTLWLNVLAIGLYMAKQYLGVDEIPNVDPMTIAVINMVLRLISSTKVSFS